MEMDNFKARKYAVAHVGHVYGPIQQINFRFFPKVERNGLNACRRLGTIQSDDTINPWHILVIRHIL